ncbi:hypothetical protein CANARDRAFT_22078 [[Candida] arabinofermentans NRRL YB-2248]|uniref:CID domain-containing protein n=1 Tax=[Candida] arabinofermentans NRRL YB-2248 TaxID=983967 RepID=A0A1E4T344_9ASCO|nr:hypothetical protein CANARDRAFT_22078 [[Candida] arabinofermentans NRRL YB-2248]
MYFNDINIYWRIMTLNPEKAKQKLLQLNDTQQSIQSTSQWLLFHHTHHKQIVQLWCSRIQDPHVTSPQKLTLFYLANDLIQLSKKDKKYAGFHKMFESNLFSVLSKVLPSLTINEKPRFVRVLNVWKERHVYAPAFVDTLLDLIEQVNKTQPSMNTPSMTSSRAASGAPKKMTSAPQDQSPKCSPELIQLSLKYDNLQQISSNTTSQFQKMNKSYNNLFKSEHLPEPSKFIAQLNALLSVIDSVDNSVSNMKATRLEIIDVLEGLINTQKEWLKLGETKFDKLNDIKGEVVAKKEDLLKLMGGEGNLQSDNEDEGADDDDDDVPTYKAGDDDDDDDGDKDEKVNDQKEEEISPSFQTGANDVDEEAVSPSFDVADDDDDDDAGIPTYDNNDDDDDDDTTNKRKSDDVVVEKAEKRVKFAEVDEYADKSDDDSTNSSGNVEINMDLDALLNKLT